MLLLLGLGWTLGAKYIVVARQGGDQLLVDLADAGRADIVFFGSMAVVFSGIYMARSSKMGARLTLFIAGLVLAWSMLDTAWLIATGVQLQPGVLRIITSDPSIFWPIVQTHLAASPVYAIAIIGSLTVGGAWILWRMISPKRLSVRTPSPHDRSMS